MPLLHGDVTERILAAFYQVHYELGPGFPEEVYSRAMEIAMTEIGLEVKREQVIKVGFRGRVVGTFRADSVVNSCVILEYKVAMGDLEATEAKLLGYLRGTHLEIGLLLKFFARPSFKRFILTNDQKNSTRIPFIPSYSVFHKAASAQ